MYVYIYLLFVDCLYICIYNAYYIYCTYIYIHLLFVNCMYICIYNAYYIYCIYIYIYHLLIVYIYICIPVYVLYIHWIQKKTEQDPCEIFYLQSRALDCNLGSA